MKINNIFFIIFFFCLFIKPEEFQVSIEENSYGGSYIIRSNKDISILDKPYVKNIEWTGESSSNQIQIINGNISHFITKNLHFSIINPVSRKIHFPSFDIKVGDKTYKTPPKTFSIKKLTNNNQQNQNNNKNYFFSLLLNNEKISANNKYDIFVGEKLVLDLIYYTREETTISRIVPNIDKRLISYKLFDIGTRNPSYFKFVNQGTKFINGNNYRYFKYKGLFFPIKEGVLRNASIRLRREQADNSFFSFFSSGSNRRVRTLHYPLPVINIKNIPPFNQLGVHNLNLVGIWSINSKIILSEREDTVKVGYPFKFIINGIGYGSDISQLNPPNISFEGFNIIEKNIRKNSQNSSIELEYILSPNDSKAKLPVIKLATFNPKLKKYDIFTVENTISIIPAKKKENQSFSNSQGKKQEKDLSNLKDINDKTINKKDNNKSLEEKLSLKDKGFNISFISLFIFSLGLIGIISFFIFRKPKEVKVFLYKGLKNLSDEDFLKVFIPRNIKTLKNDLKNFDKLYQKITELYEIQYLKQEEKEKFLRNFNLSEIKLEIYNYIKNNDKNRKN